MKTLLLSLICFFCCITFSMAASMHGNPSLAVQGTQTTTEVPHTSLKNRVAVKAVQVLTKKVNDLNKKRKCKRGPGAMYFVWLTLIILVALAGIAAFIYVFANLGA